MAKPIELPFGTLHVVGPMNHVIYEHSNQPTKQPSDGHVYWHHLSKAVEPLFTAGTSKSVTKGGERHSLFPNYYGQSCGNLTY